MQDREFDKVFNSKFNEFEVTPSPGVWDGIVDELDKKPARRYIIPFLSIAASIIVLLGIGVLFLQQKTNKQQPVQKIAAKYRHEIIKQTDITPLALDQPGDKTTLNTHHTTTPAIKLVMPLPRESNTDSNIVKETIPVKADNQLVLIAAAPVVPAVVQPLDVPAPPKTLNIEQQKTTEKPIMIASVEQENAAPLKKRGIHNLGGLINIIVAKIDKREDKLIEFTDNDEDDGKSTVTGINLGIIKIKKQQ